jgi:cytochrome P450
MNERNMVYEKFGGRCAYCGVPLHRDRFDVDHVQPQSRGGSSDLSNLFPSCQTCNRVKSDRNIQEWKDYIRHRIAERLNASGAEVFESKYISSDKDKVLVPLLKAYNEIYNTDVTFYFEKHGADTEDDGGI